MKIQLSSGQNLSAEPRIKDQAIIVIVANFSGQYGRRGAPSEQPSLGKMINLDPYDIDASIKQYTPRIIVESGDHALDIRINNMEDFHPDTLFRHLDIFTVTKALKHALADPEKAPRALEVASKLTGFTVSSPGKSTPVAREEDDPEHDMFLRLLGRNSDNTEHVGQTVDKLLTDIVGNDAISETPESVTQMLQQLDDLDQEAMRGLLMHDAFREVEAAWRSVLWLGQNIESDSQVQIWLLDAAPASPADWASEAHSLITRSLAGEPVSVISVLQDFSGTDESAMQLKSLCDLSTAASCAVLSGADASLAGLAGNPASYLTVDASDIRGDHNPSIRELRSKAATIGLGFPRLLLRQPYGKRSDPVDAFPFEELPSAPHHETFFWVSSAIGLALVWISQHLGSADSLEIRDTPMVTYDDGSGQAIKPSSEFYLSDSAVDMLMANGFMPLFSRRGDTGITVPRLQSLEDPAKSL